ncbi:pilus assembly protein [Arthrobacter pascens]|uniref:pilus assembly protein n=1 Tax=Arthrobacter pascens TaxID=1677 RepID=UPI0027DDAAC5|nr:pilus assembly protein [Arthrobacter pascens]
MLQTPPHRARQISARGGRATDRRATDRAAAGRAAADSRGAVTAEFAVALPAVIMLLAMLLAGSAAGITQLRLEEAARAGVRALARGEEPAAVDGIVRKLAGGSATSVVETDGEWLSVTVTDRAAGPLGTVVPWTLTATAEARGEAAAIRIPGTHNDVAGGLQDAPRAGRLA